MRLALAAALGLVVFLPAPLAAQETELGAVDPTADTEVDPVHECTPWPACYFDPPSPPPIGGIGGIFSTGRAPGFELEGSWGVLEMDEESQQFILRPTQDQWQSPGEFGRPHYELPR